MKGIICYYSGSGNTKLACGYIKSRIKNADFELYNIVKTEIPDFSKFDVAGFATFTNFAGVSQYLYSFFEKLKPQAGKHAFLFNTFGFMPGHALDSLAELAASRGFNVLSGHSLHAPEAYPPMRARGIPFDNSPNPKEMAKFDDFISRLDNLLGLAASGQVPENEKIKTGLLNSIFPRMPRSRAKQDLGEQKVDETLCIQCGTCERGCPYGAVHLAPKPVFDHGKCQGCWACYNHCAQKAIYTKKFRGKGQYPKPSPQLAEKLAAGI